MFSDSARAKHIMKGSSVEGCVSSARNLYLFIYLGFPEEMKKFIAQEKSYAFTRDGDSFRETTTFGPGVELKSCLKLNQLNDWKDSEENPKMHIQVCLFSFVHNNRI